MYLLNVQILQVNALYMEDSMPSLYLKREIILCSHDTDQLVYGTHTLFRTPVHLLCQDVRQILQTHTILCTSVYTQGHIIEHFPQRFKCINIVLRIHRCVHSVCIYVRMYFIYVCMYVCICVIVCIVF